MTFRSAGRFCAAAAWAWVGWGSRVEAEVLVSNLAKDVRAASPMGNNPNSHTPPVGKLWYWAAQSFTTDDATYSLVSIEVVVGDGSDDPVPAVIAELYADNKGAIGAFITSLTAPDLSGAASARTFTPDAPVTLDPGARYWFLLGVAVPDEGVFSWAYAASNDFIGPGYITGYADSSDSGTNWNYGTDFPYFIQVNVSISSDSDGDGIEDIDDVCCDTPLGTAVDSQGRPVGDLDLDCDNDLDDYAIFSRGFTGPLTGSGPCP